MNNAVVTLVNHNHGDKSFHVLATSNNLFLDLDTMTPLSEWLKSRADMPQEVNAVFNPDITEDWGENAEYICKVEPLVCLLDGVYWRVFQEDGEIKGYHPDATWVKGHDGKDHPILVPDVNEGIVEHHIKSDIEQNKSSLSELQKEMAKGLLSGEAYEQESALLKLLIKVK